MSDSNDAPKDEEKLGSISWLCNKIQTKLLRALSDEGLIVGEEGR